MRRYTETVNIEHAVFDALECTVLLRQTSEYFELIYQVDGWSKIVLSHLPVNKVRINQSCLFLIDFLIDAELFWARDDGGLLHSGFWTEQLENGDLLHFEAFACVASGKEILVIKNVVKAYAQQQRTLQVARETTINNEFLQQEVDDTHQRIGETISKNIANEMQVIDIISSAVDHANFGIILLNSDLTAILQNPLTYQLFNIKEQSVFSKNTPISLICQLMKKQFPEHKRIFEAGVAWYGELYWLAAPHYVKWLKVSIKPIKGTLGEITHWVFYINDISRIKHLLQHNEKLAHYDSLTELPNRQLFWSMLEKSCTQQNPFFLIYLNIDNFKYINENYGHAEGDTLLVTITERLESFLKKDDAICRIGGDEFAVILKNVYGENPHKSCESIGQRILTLINEPYDIEGKDKISITASLGISHFPSDSNSPDLLVKYADLAVYNAKLTGKNNMKFYSKELQQKTANRMALENELRKAIDNDNFEVLLQPIIDIKTGVIIKAEALVRWEHPTKGRIMPDKFIAISEETGLIIPLGKLIFIHVCKHIKLLDLLGYKHQVSVNLSPKQIYDNSFYPFIYETLAKYDILPERIELEITESALAHDFDLVLQTLEKLKEGGISISVDDFGTGYSSLAYLKRLPVDYLKIDRSFIIDIAKDDSDQAIVAAIITMAHRLNLKVIAEGVEDEDQLALLKEMDCDAVQGYLYSRPLGFDQFSDFFQMRKK